MKKTYLLLLLNLFSLLIVSCADDHADTTFATRIMEDGTSPSSVSDSSDIGYVNETIDNQVFDEMHSSSSITNIDMDSAEVSLNHDHDENTNSNGVINLPKHEEIIKKDNSNDILVADSSIGVDIIDDSPSAQSSVISTEDKEMDTVVSEQPYIDLVRTDTDEEFQVLNGEQEHSNLSEKVTIPDDEETFTTNDLPINVDDTIQEKTEQVNTLTIDRDEHEHAVVAIAKSGGQTEKRFNFASHAAGAVVLDKSSTSKGFNYLLDDDKDKYGISPCNDDKWVVLGLSEDVVVSSIILANYEKYSSMLNEFSIAAATVYPTDKWSDLGVYNAAPKLGEQQFDMTHGSNSQVFSGSHTRYLKINFISHYSDDGGYDDSLCTISQIKVHGTTVIASFQQEVERDNADSVRSVLQQLNLQEQEKQQLQKDTLIANDNDSTNSITNGITSDAGSNSHSKGNVVQKELSLSESAAQLLSSVLAEEAAELVELHQQQLLQEQEQQRQLLLQQQQQEEEQQQILLLEEEIRSKKQQQQDNEEEDKELQKMVLLTFDEPLLEQPTPIDDMYRNATGKYSIETFQLSYERDIAVIQPSIILYEQPHCDHSAWQAHMDAYRIELKRYEKQQLSLHEHKLQLKIKLDEEKRVLRQKDDELNRLLEEGAEQRNETQNELSGEIPIVTDPSDRDHGACAVDESSPSVDKSSRKMQTEIVETVLNNENAITETHISSQMNSMDGINSIGTITSTTTTKADKTVNDDSTESGHISVDDMIDRNNSDDKSTSANTIKRDMVEAVHKDMTNSISSMNDVDTSDVTSSTDTGTTSGSKNNESIDKNSHIDPSNRNKEPMGLSSSHIDTTVRKHTPPKFVSVNDGDINITEELHDSSQTAKTDVNVDLESSPISDLSNKLDLLSKSHVVKVSSLDIDVSVSRSIDIVDSEERDQNKDLLPLTATQQRTQSDLAVVEEIISHRVLSNENDQDETPVSSLTIENEGMAASAAAVVEVENKADIAATIAASVEDKEISDDSIVNIDHNSTGIATVTGKNDGDTANVSVDSRSNKANDHDASIASSSPNDDVNTNIVPKFSWLNLDSMSYADAAATVRMPLTSKDDMLHHMKTVSPGMTTVSAGAGTTSTLSSTPSTTNIPTTISTTSTSGVTTSTQTAGGTTTTTAAVTCLELLKFPNFQAKMLAKLKAGSGDIHPSTGGSDNVNSQDNVFKVLMTKIKNLETSQAILELYTAQISDCYRNVLTEHEKLLGSNGNHIPLVTSHTSIVNNSPHQPSMNAGISNISGSKSKISASSSQSVPQHISSSGTDTGQAKESSSMTTTTSAVSTTSAASTSVVNDGKVGNTNSKSGGGSSSTNAAQTNNTGASAIISDSNIVPSDETGGDSSNKPDVAKGVSSDISNRSNKKIDVKNDELLVSSTTSKAPPLSGSSDQIEEVVKSSLERNETKSAVVLTKLAGYTEDEIVFFVYTAYAAAALSFSLSLALVAYFFLGYSNYSSNMSDKRS